ncbi:MAG: stage V sporulation protein AD [Clostridia bacterium]|nr:stage V sporulation protein AD [Clostridia bacterium]
MGKIVRFKNPPKVISVGTVAGAKESEGRLKGYFDLCDKSDKFGKKTFEQSESEMQRLALNFALKKADMSPNRLDAIFAGDLMNQCTGSSYGLAAFSAPYFGLYGACSTAAEGLILGAMAVDSGYFDTVATVSSSHNSSAERQFRFPLEYGSQRPPTAQWTVTAAAAFVLGKSAIAGNAENEKGHSCIGEKNGVCVKITEALPGRIVDKGITDQSNMGAAMAPAAAATLYSYFKESDSSPDDFDMILTGDLGYDGHAICRDLLIGMGLDLGKGFSDCGILIYDRNTQDTHCGGSGCGCSASVMAGFVMDRFKKGEIKDVLLVGTGALMSPSSVLQGLSIAGIGHLVRLSAR